MKKLSLSLVITLCATVSFAQYQTRYTYANKDTLRNQIRMAVIDVAVDRIDTASNSSFRLCADVLSQPTASYWLDVFTYQIVVQLPTSTPTDGTIRNYVIALWVRVSQLNSRR